MRRPARKRILSPWKIIIFTTVLISVYFLSNQPRGEEILNLQNQTSMEITESNIDVITPAENKYTEPMEGYYPSTYGFEKYDQNTLVTNIYFFDEYYTSENI